MGEEEEEEGDEEDGREGESPVLASTTLRVGRETVQCPAKRAWQRLWLWLLGWMPAPASVREHGPDLEPLAEASPTVRLPSDAPQCKWAPEGRVWERDPSSAGAGEGPAAKAVCLHRGLSPAMRQLKCSAMRSELALLLPLPPTPSLAQPRACASAGDPPPPLLPPLPLLHTLLGD